MDSFKKILPRQNQLWSLQIWRQVLIWKIFLVLSRCIYFKCQLEHIYLIKLECFSTYFQKNYTILKLEDIFRLKQSFQLILSKKI